MGQVGARRRQYVVDHQADLVAHQLSHQRRAVVAGKAAFHGPEVVGDEIQLEELVEHEEARAEPIVDVVVIVSDVIRKRRDLRLERRAGRKVERIGGIQLRKRPARLDHRAIVFRQPFEQLPAQVEPGHVDVRTVEPHDHAQGVFVVRKAAPGGERRIERFLAGVAEGRMADVVGEAQGLGEVLVEGERASQHASDLRHFQAMRQPDAKMVAVGRDENLRLAGKATERD